jgi:hypothetical protein
MLGALVTEGGVRPAAAPSGRATYVLARVCSARCVSVPHKHVGVPPAEHTASTSATCISEVSTCPASTIASSTARTAESGKARPALMTEIQ